MDSQMYIPLSLGITTVVSLVMLIVGQIMTFFKINKLATRCPGMCVGGAAVGAAAASSHWWSGLTTFGRLVIDKIKDKFKDKAADKIADTSVETVVEVVEQPKVEQPKA